MQTRIFALVAAASVLLTAQQDAPLRGPGRFTATAAGVLSGTVSGDASVTKFQDGRRELYLMLNSDQMMARSMMISATIRLPASAGMHTLKPPTGYTLIRWENLTAHTGKSALATGTIEFKGKDVLSGKFSITATAGAETMTLTGIFEDAPIIKGID